MPPLTFSRMLDAVPGPAGRFMLEQLVAHSFGRSYEWIPDFISQSGIRAADADHGGALPALYRAVDCRMSWLTGGITPAQITALDAEFTHGLTRRYLMKSKHQFFHNLPYFIRVWLMQDAQVYAMDAYDKQCAERMNSVLAEHQCSHRFRAADWVAGLSQTYSTNSGGPDLFYRFLRVSKKDRPGQVPIARVGIGQLFTPRRAEKHLWGSWDATCRDVLSDSILDSVCAGTGDQDILRTCNLTEPCSSYRNLRRTNLPPAETGGTAPPSKPECRALVGPFPMRPSLPRAGPDLDTLGADFLIPSRGPKTPSAASAGPSMAVSPDSFSVRPACTVPQLGPDLSQIPPLASTLNSQRTWGVQ